MRSGEELFHDCEDITKKIQDIVIHLALNATDIKISKMKAKAYIFSITGT